MIDWWGFFYNSLWVVGLTVVLAVFSMASYQARVEGVRLWRRLSAPRLQAPFNLGMALFCLGLVLTSRSWWEQAVFSLLALLFAVGGVRLWRRRHGDAAG
jgi:hypothetical protein